MLQRFAGPPEIIGILQILRKRIIDASMDTFQADPAENADLQEALQVENAQLQSHGLQAQQLAVQAGVQPPPIVLLLRSKRS